MGLLTALRFLTVIPLPTRHRVTDRELGRASGWFPLVGTFLGGILVLAGYWGIRLWNPLTVSALILVLWVLLTRGFHLDGLADTLDGLGGGRSREEKLSIMKDSRSGVFGVLALLCLLLLKLVFLLELGTRAYGQGLLVLAPTLGRWGMVVVIKFFPYVREAGLGRGIKEHCRWAQVACASLTALAAVLLLAGLGGVILILGVGALVTIIGLLLTRRLGGLTGDTYGALCELGELGTLLMLTLLKSPTLGIFGFPASSDS